MTITSIVPVDKRKCKVFVDEGFAFVLYKGEIGRLGLAEGATLSEELYRQIETELLNRRARERSVDLLKASDKSESQIRSRLEEDGFPQPVIDRTIALLKKHRYVDDEAFARRYVENGGTRKSRRQLAYELRQKGVDSELVDQALREAAPPEEETVRRLVQKKVGNPGDLSREELQKLYAFLGRKGYSYEVIRRVIGEICDEYQ